MTGQSYKTMAKKVIKDQPAKNIKMKVKTPKGNTMKKVKMKKGGSKMC